MNNPDKGRECERVKEGFPPPALFQSDRWRLKRILITAILITKAKAPFQECPADWIFLSLFLPFHFLQTTTALSLPLEQNLEHLSQALKCQEKAWMGGNLVPPALPCLDILHFMDIWGGVEGGSIRSAQAPYDHRNHPVSSAQGSPGQLWLVLTPFCLGLFCEKTMFLT